MLRQEAPKVSVVIPTYNRPEYLKEALASVVGQTYRDLEIIVHDNASDTSPEVVIEGFGDPRIRLYRNPTNLGQFANFLAGMNKARGEYVAVLGDDDRWHPEFLSVLVGKLEADPDLVLAFCDHDIIDQNGNVDLPLTGRITRRWRRHLLRDGVYSPFDEIALVYRAVCTVSAAVFRRRYLELDEIPVGVGLGFDLYLAYVAARTGRGCHYVSRRLAQYRYHGGSVSSSLAGLEMKIHNAQDALFYWDRMMNDGRVARARRYCEMKRGYSALRLAWNMLRRGDRDGARRQLADALRQGVISPRIFLYHLIYGLRLRRLTA